MRAVLVIIAAAIASCGGLDRGREVLPITSAQGADDSDQITLTVIHPDCGPKPMLEVEDGRREVAVRVLRIADLECPGEVESMLTVSLSEPLGGRDLRLETKGQGTECIIEGETNAACIVGIAED